MVRTEFDLDDRELTTLAATIGMCILIGLERHIPKHKAVGRKIRVVEDAINDLARLNGCRLSPELSAAGVEAWGAAMEKLQEILLKEVQCIVESGTC